MRLLTLLQLSTAATCPLLLLSLPKLGAQPVTPSDSLKPEENNDFQSFLRSAAITAPTPSVAPPNVTARATIAAPQFSTKLSVKPVTAPPAATVKSQAKPVTKPAAPAIRPNFTQRPDFSWDRIIERSLPASLLSRPASPIAAKKAIASPNQVKASKPGPKQAQTPRQLNTPLITAIPPTLNDSSAVIPPIDTPYVLGTGDTIQLTVVNVPEFSGQQQVGTDGSILLPVVGRVGIAGLSVPEAEATLANRLSRELRRPRILITVLKSRPLRVGIAGEIKQPGFYTMSAADAIQAPSIVQAIQQAGGVTLSANLQRVEIRRRDRVKGTQKITVNLSEIAQTGDLSQNLSLRDGDSIFIPTVDAIDLAAIGQLAESNLATTGQAINVALIGEVTRPGAYKMEGAKEGGSRPTLTQAIQQAGGITADADLRQVQVRRLTRSGKPQLISLNLWQLLREGDLSQDLLLQPGDTIRLVKAPDMSAEDLIQQGNANVSPGAIRVNVLGEVKGAGAAQLPPNSTLNQAILAAGGLDRRAAKTVELIRLNPNGTVTRRSIRIDLSRGIDPVNNPVLRNNDVIVVGRSGFTKFSDGLSDVLSPIFRLLPLQLLF
ncbi:SLBB domain-containing protein [Leptolyngbya sp. FACHB-17]|uniref:SLBB domain-containing protein n=1 Tax=unclassified Leptolyngbya TaxID=2650499 RepID=UPI0016801300|nr:SLBB domain-containing protein [Leptolyngbya sp. FACHB-17]MBD2081293.1 SLBB domain-containing protein [Leptolyngbya sp. FACHB-17]